MTNWKSPAETWPERTTERISAAIKAERERRKITAGKLAEATERLGFPISRYVISDIETGRKRSIDIPELLVIAAALGVSPITLLYPEIPDGVIDVLPEWPARSWDALQWFTGERWLPPQDPDRFRERTIVFDDDGKDLTDDELREEGWLDLPAAQDALAKLRLLRERDRIAKAFRDTLAREVLNSVNDDDTDRDELRGAREAFKARLDSLNRELRQLDKG